MENCLAQKLLQDSSEAKNVFKTMFHCHKIDSYFERHHIIEILGELLIRVCIDRPEIDKLVEYLCQKLMEISRKHRRSPIKLEFVNAFDEGSKIISQLAACQRLPVIEYSGSKTSLNEIFKDVDKVLKSNLLNEQRVIICNFKEHHGKEEKLLRITRKLDETSQNGFLKPQDAIEIQLSRASLNHRQLRFICEKVLFSNPEKLIKGNWNRRVMIVGRIGSGRTTQGALIANEFGLNLIDCDNLMAQYQQRPSLLSKHRLGFLGFLQEALLNPPCLRNGYVIVSTVISRRYLEILMEKFIYTPNRIIFMHTSPRECHRRLLATKRILQNDAGTPGTNISFNYQMNLYNLHKKEFAEYFKSSRRKKILHVDGNGSVREITEQIIANLIGG
jgi:shikimate kinase